MLLSSVLALTFAESYRLENGNCSD